jgi:hypothetical protein
MTSQINLVLLILGCIANSLSFEAKAQKTPEAVAEIQKYEPPKGYLIANFTVSDSMTFQKIQGCSGWISTEAPGKNDYA